MKVVLATILTAFTLSAFADSASGTLTVNGKIFQIQHAYALQVEDWTDKSKNATLVVVTDKALPPSVVNEDIDTFAIRDAGANGIKFEFYSEGTNYAMMLSGVDLDGSVSVSGTFDKEQLSDLSATHIAAHIVNEKEVGDTKFQYDIRFDAEVAPRVIPLAPTAEDTAAAQNKESTKAYFAFYQALKAGDLDALRAMVDPERAKAMDQPDFKENLEFIQSMMPTDVKVLKATETADRAELILSGRDGEDERAGTVLMLKKNGKWLLEEESWKSK